MAHLCTAICGFAGIGPATLFEHSLKALLVSSQGSCEHVSQKLLHCVQQEIYFISEAAKIAHSPLGKLRSEGG